MTDQATIDKVVEFHGHMCAGLALGIRAAEVGLAEVGPHAPDEEVVAVVETDMCGVDAIQFRTGCTFGKGTWCTGITARTPIPSFAAPTARRCG
jgi:formylmethanofuran dehydrogenase subunit E